MRVVIQRVKEASVTIKEKVEGSISKGLLILIGVEEADTRNDVKWLVQKIVQQRIFRDEEGRMNLSVKDVDGEILVISQFTLHASTKKGNRPSFMQAARPEKAIPLYEYFLENLADALEKPVECGIFGTDMDVSLINHGPVTITMDSRNRE
jgi:D-aminoacyl-tRNA deacylase